MSVMVATAYMDEAQRFDWLMAMDDGKIIAHGTLQEMLDKAGEPTLEEAFIALLPEQKRALHQKVIVRPRVGGPDEVPAIEAEGLTRRFGDFDWRRRMLEGGLQAVQADEDVVGTSRVRELERRVPRPHSVSPDSPPIFDAPRTFPESIVGHATIRLTCCWTLQLVGAQVTLAKSR